MPRNLYILACFILLIPSLGLGLQDTIPPSFTLAPRDTTFNCDQDITSFLTDWYTSQAGATADNGQASVVAELSLQATLDSMANIRLESCGNTGTLLLGFFAIDSCNLRSDETLFASFIIEDRVKPTFISQAIDKEVVCSEFTLDTLQQWLDAHGDAIAEDNCSDSFHWTSYIWTDDLNNSGFAESGEPTNIVIQRTNCEWSVNVSFFVEDECGNDNVTTAAFRIISDGESPVVESTPANTVIQCGSPIPDAEPIIRDACDGILDLLVRDSTTRINDPDSCAFYNYRLYRIWKASDACGNSANTMTTYQISDTLAPLILLDAVVVVDCETDLNDYSQFITVSDSCSAVNIEVNDNILVSNQCQLQLEREWIARDICGNQNTVTQTIQVQDFNGPEFISHPSDTIVSCSSNELALLFDEWLDSKAGGIVSDGCNSTRSKILVQGNYQDTLLIFNANKPQYESKACSSTDSLGFISNQTLTFVAYDLCGNITQSDILFSVIDNNPPQIPDCPQGFQIFIDDSQCEATYNIITPVFTDNCLTTADAEWTIFINGVEDILPATGLSQDLPIGDNSLVYLLTDCGSNQVSCEQVITVSDASPPVIECIQDTVVYLSSDCEEIFLAPGLLSYDDNCLGLSSYSEQQPPDEGFLVFDFNNFGNIYQATDKNLSFTPPIDNGILYSPSLQIKHKVNLQGASSILIKDENDRIIYEIENGNCREENDLIILNTSDFNIWAADGSVQFTIVHNASNNFGTIPCEPQNLIGQQDTDESSILQLTLNFTEVVVETELTLVQSQFPDPIIRDTILKAGTYKLAYSVSDLAGNTATCLSNIEIKDTLAPIINCQDFTYVLDPLLIGFYPLIESQLEFDALDNCNIGMIEFEPKQLFCSQNDTQVPYVMQVTDTYNNQANCSANINVVTAELNPNFVSSLCFADTLKLFSGLDPGLGLSLSWEGPDGFESTQSDPIIIGLSEEKSGTYTLSATNVEGCVFQGTVEVDVNEFDSPLIFTFEPTVCQGEDLLLNANSFTELVEYFWYEGISPNGTLIGQTMGPSLSLNPTLGQHFYYVEAQGNDCNSRPSNTLEVMVIEPPRAEIRQPFITICEGEDIVLGTDIFNSGYDYEWTGPNNYSSSGQFPEIINNATELDQGIYTLVINDDICASDSASAEVIVFNKPNLPIITGETIFCEGQSAVLSVPNIPNGTRYQWFLNGIFYNSVSSNSLLIPAISTNLAGIWTVIVEEGICSSDVSDEFEVVVDRGLNIGATNDGPHCEGDSVTLTSSFIPNATYTWEDPKGIQSEGRIIRALAESGVYTVTVRTPSNCSATTTTLVEVEEKPQITALSNTSLPCMTGNSPITLVPSVFPAGNYQYTWEGPNGYTSNQEQPIINNANEDANGIYTLSIRQGNCESEVSFTSIEITVIPEDAELSISKLPCLGDEIILSVLNPIQDGALNWIWNTPKGIIETSFPELIITDFQSNDIGNYSVIQERNNCRALSSEIVMVDLLSEMLIPNIIAQDNYCEGETAELSVSNISTGEFTWFTPGGTVTTNNSQLLINDISSADEGAYQVFVQDGNCDSDTSAIVNLQVLDSPSSPEVINKNYDICPTSSSDLEICIDNTDLIFDKIKLKDIRTGTTIQESTQACFDLEFLLNDNNDRILELEVISELGECQSTENDTVVIRIFGNDEVKAEFDSDSIIVCGDDFTRVTLSGIPFGVSTNWKVDDPDLNLFIESDREVSLSNLQEGVNRLTVSSSNIICENFATDTLIIVSIQNIETSDDELNVSFNQEININPLINDEFISSIFLSILEEPENGNISVEQEIITYSPDQGFIGEVTIPYEICYENCRSLCDDAEIKLTVGENVDCFIGTILTPNNDGYNDILIAPCLDSGNFPDNKLTILNQWGDEIFSASPYSNNWDGYYNGKPLPDGTYFYIFDIGNGSRPLNGYIILER